MKLVLLIFLFNPMSFYSHTLNEGDEILGIWVTADKRAKIEIYKESGVYSGKIVWLEKDKDSDGNPIKDINNADESLRDRPVLGMDIISDFVFDGNKRWEDGIVYDADKGKTYSCIIKLKHDRLEVRGYIRFPIFGKTVVWRRE